MPALHTLLPSRLPGERWTWLAGLFLALALTLALFPALLSASSLSSAPLAQAHGTAAPCMEQASDHKHQASSPHAAEQATPAHCPDHVPGCAAASDCLASCALTCAGFALHALPASSFLLVADRHESWGQGLPRPLFSWVPPLDTPPPIG